jgi:hypothetical protein
MPLFSIGACLIYSYYRQPSEQMHAHQRSYKRKIQIKEPNIIKNFESVAVGLFNIHAKFAKNFLSSNII